MSKLSFRARALDASKPMPIFMAEELPDLPDYSAINRAVPQMPSGMEKEEECEHHLQRAICAGLIIPTPEVSDIPQKEFYEKVYPANYKQPRQLIHMQPFTMEQDIPDYDMDSEDERWLQSQTQKLELNPLKFEEMMDRLEKSSGQIVVTLNEAKAILKEDDDLIIAVFDYWLNKRLKTKHPLVLSVKTEHRAGIAANNPYLAFRRRTDKMQTRKNRKNDEVSYEKMLKLKRDFCRAVTLLELVKKREKMKRELVHLTVEVFEKRYNAKDFNGAIVNEMALVKPTTTSTRPAFTPIFHNHYGNQAWTTKSLLLKDDRKEKRQYKKRKHKSYGHNRTSGLDNIPGGGGTFSSDEEMTVGSGNVTLISPDEQVEDDDEGQFAFRRNKNCSYHMPCPQLGNWAWCSKNENGGSDKRFRYNLTSIHDRRNGGRRCIGLARRRIGRGGRMILDRASTVADDEFWRTLDFTITEPTVKNESDTTTSITTTPSSETRNDDDEMLEFIRSIRRDWLHFRPKTPPMSSSGAALDEDRWCQMESIDESYWKPGSTSPFSLEIQNLDVDTTNSLFDSVSFFSDTFAFNDSNDNDSNETKNDEQQQQHHQKDNDNNDTKLLVKNLDNNKPNSTVVRTTTALLNVNVGINTLNNRTSSNNHDENVVDNNFIVNNNKKLWFCDRTNGGGGLGGNNEVGSSKFRVWDERNDDDINTSCGENSLWTDQLLKIEEKTSITPTTTTTVNTNGILPQYNYEKTAVGTSPGGTVGVVKRKNNKLTYAYNNDGGLEATSGISLHTSAHTLTLNSHSANIFEISTDGNNVTNEIPCTESGGTNSTSNTNKSKTIVRKNNFVMEVT